MSKIIIINIRARTIRNIEGKLVDSAINNVSLAAIRNTTIATPVRRIS
jgi:hypothetical protein